MVPYIELDNQKVFLTFWRFPRRKTWKETIFVLGLLSAYSEKLVGVLSMLYII